MTTTDSIWAAAEHLLRRDAEELRESSTSSQDRDDWTGEEEAKEDYDKHIAVADALASLSTAEPVQPLYGWVLVPAKPTREWIGAVADDGYADCDVAQLIASILSHAPAAPTAQAAPAAQGDALTPEDADQLEKVINDFNECGETDVPYTALQRYAAMGYLECSHYHVLPAARAAIDAARAAKEGGAT